MAGNKVTRSRKRRKRPIFAEIKGKVVKDVEVMPGENGYSIGILFEDKTFLSFDVEPYLTVSPELSDLSKEEYTPLKRWPTVRS